MILVGLAGGLGNIMFQLSAGYSIAKERDAVFRWRGNPSSSHTSARGVDYRRGILAPAMNYEPHDPSVSVSVIIENLLHPIDTDLIKQGNNYLLAGYLQNYRYCSRDSIRALFDFADNPLPDAEPSYFLQVRRGDYLRSRLHNLNLQDGYFQQALKIASERHPGALTLVLSDDIPWCQDWEPLKDMRVQFIEENAEVSMRIMHHASIGGITSNSSFGWWGLYSNLERPLHILPDRWLNDDRYYTKGYYYPGCCAINL